MKMNNLRLPAEWEPCSAVLLAWPHADTDWAYMLDRAESCYDQLVSAISRFAMAVVIAPDAGYVSRRLEALGLAAETYTVVECPTNDTWTRDYGPITTTAVTDEGHRVNILNDYRFNGWGLKFAANHDNLVTRRLVMGTSLTGRYRNCQDFVLEGGSVESDGNGIILTTRRCLLSPNRNEWMSRRQIEQRLKADFGAHKILMLDNGGLDGDDTDGHIDTLARLAPDNTIIYVGCQDPADPQYDDLSVMRNDIRSLRTLTGEPFNLYELPMPAAVYDADGQRLPATYANYLVVNGGVLVPVYGQPKTDRLACQILASVFHDRQVVPVDCSALIEQHGSLHCSTMQLL